MDPSIPAEVLCERRRFEKHGMHVSYTRYIPMRYVAVERFRLMEHAVHVSYT